jgi:hypothetical protein
MRTWGAAARMMAALGLLAWALLAGCSGGKASELDEIDRSTPEAVVMNFCQALNDQDVYLMHSTLDPDDSGTRVILEGFKGQISSGVWIDATNIELYVMDENDRYTLIKCSCDQSIYVDGVLIESGPTASDLALVEKEDGWYIAASYSINRG